MGNETSDEDFPDEPFDVQIWHSDNRSEVVNSHRHFFAFTGQMCQTGHASSLDPDEYPTDVYKILHNGSLYHPNIKMDNMRGAEHFCLSNVRHQTK